MTSQLGVAMIGYAFMGAAHSQGWRTAPRTFDLPQEPVMKTIVGRNESRVKEAAHKLGWESYSTDWRTVLERDDIDVVDICTPGDTHRDIAVAALAAGKHVLCEKPLANSVEEAKDMARQAHAAAAGGVVAMLGFTYRRVPAIQLARKLVADGRIGTIRHVRAQYLQDWLVDPAAPYTWRLNKNRAGSGALGDTGAHIIDLTQFITGQLITDVTGTLNTFITERSETPGAEPQRVTVDDAASFLAVFDGGASGVFEATRFATGRKNSIRVEINGSLGSLAFDFEDMNVLHFYDGTNPSEEAGFRRILVTEPEHAYVAHWWPAGHVLGYENPFSHQVADLVEAISTGQQPRPSFDDGLQVQRVLAAVERSSASRLWASVNAS